MILLYVFTCEYCRGRRFRRIAATKLGGRVLRMGMMSTASLWTCSSTLSWIRGGSRHRMCSSFHALLAPVTNIMCVRTDWNENKRQQRVDDAGEGGRRRNEPRTNPERQRRRLQWPPPPHRQSCIHSYIYVYVYVCVLLTPPPVAVCSDDGEELRPTPEGNLGYFLHIIFIHINRERKRERKRLP